jgi:hypothetical protein
MAILVDEAGGAGNLAQFSRCAPGCKSPWKISTIALPAESRKDWYFFSNSRKGENPSNHDDLPVGFS